MTDAISNRDALLTSWKNAKDALTTATLAERELRSQVIAAFSETNDEMYSGTESIDIGFGYDLKIVHNLKYTLDNSNDFEKTDKALDEIEAALGDIGELIVDRLVKRKLEISVSEYKELPPEAKKIIDRVLTIKPASKSVEIKKRGK